ncbi:MAG TPA: choice-of-anchor tandem repeat GloVer-containing protein [Parafilimonas sp.]|nr:choice-of-anchor tandem repeat GloVer-containing protein [Parafilimonas sp.]
MKKKFTQAIQSSSSFIRRLMRPAIIIFILADTFTVYGQAPIKEWDKTFGSSDDDNFSCVRQTADGGYIVGGYTTAGISGDKTQASRGSYDYWIVKIDASGNKQWDKTFGGSAADNLNTLQQTADGGYILGGYSASNISGDKTEWGWGESDYWIVKIDADGNKQWDKTFGGYTHDWLFSLQQTADSGYILGGLSGSGIGGDKTQPSQGDFDYWVVKIDAGGNKQWDKTFGSGGYDQLSFLQQTTDGGYILGGTSASGISGDKTQASQGGNDYWIVKIDGNGNKQWDKTFGGSDDDNLLSLQQTADGGYIAGGLCWSGAGGDKTQASKGYLDYWIVKIDGSGNKQWDKDFGTSDVDRLRSMQQTTDGGYILGGFSSSGINGDKTEASKGQSDYWIVKIDGSGNKQWDKDFGGKFLDEFNFLRQTADGGFILGGRSTSGISGDKTQNNQGYYDYWVVKLCQNPITYYRDADGDEFGDANTAIQACSPPPGYVANNTDCNDNDAGVYAPITYYRDADGDGFGDPDKPKTVCSSKPPAGYVALSSPKILYGTASSGGSDNIGVICKLNTATNIVTPVFSFSAASSNGYSPQGGLVQATDGKLYGMAAGDGGSYGWGVIFSYDPAKGIYKKLKDFNNANGGYPAGNLIQASDGKLYGMTSLGGSSGVGVIFSYNPATAAYNKLKDFNHTNGAYPFGGLIQASNGKLYGLTSGGGSSGNGVMFSFDPATSTYTKLKDFDNYTIGSAPYGSLVQASDGKLYGMTSGGYYAGVIFSYNPATADFTKLIDFDYTNGSTPYGNLIQASDGKLYGMTYSGGGDDNGVIFSFDPSTSTYAKLKDFNETSGKHPFGSLMQAPDGKLYGMTAEGGSNGGGVSFSYDPAASTFTKLADFTGANGGYPVYTYFTGVASNADCNDSDASLHAPVTYYHDADGDGFGNPVDKISACASTPPTGYVTDSTDCNDRNASVHSGKLSPKPSISGDSAFCPGATAQLISSAATTYLWNTGATTKTIKTTAAGSYTVTTTKGAKCQNTSKPFVVTTLPCAKPAALTVSNITATGATLKWGSPNCAGKYRLQVKIKNAADWTTYDSVQQNSKVLTGLKPNKTYMWQVQAICGGSPAAVSDFSKGKNFKTKAAAALVAAAQAATLPAGFSVTPNPASSIVHIAFTGYSGKVTIHITDINGKQLAERKVYKANAPAQQEIDISNIANGVYLVTVTDEQGNRQTEKLVIAK